MTDTITQNLVDRFIRYVGIESQSDAKNNYLPSSEGQRRLAAGLVEELRSFGYSDVVVNEQAIVIAHYTGKNRHAPKIGFVAHLDTIDTGLKPQVKPQIQRFTGQDICLNQDEDIWFKINEHPEALPYVGQDIIFSDGTSVLGADNKAAVAVLMTLAQQLQEHQPDVGDIFLAFVPDEEIGLKGSKVLDLEQFDVDFAYTIDCCELGELVYETFNAACFSLHIQGVPAHPMAAKGVLVNPLRITQDLMNLFDSEQTPECTHEREGYYWFTHLQANPSEATLSLSIRDFNQSQFLLRKQFVIEAIEKIGAQYPSATITYTIEDLYENIANYVDENHLSLKVLFSAFEENQVKKKIIPMRGGTDGSMLSARGCVTPNYFTGAHNFHSRFEFLPIPSFEKSYQVTWSLCRQVVKQAIG